MAEPSSDKTYKEGDDLTNIKALKEKMFKKAMHGLCEKYEIEAAFAFANLVRAEIDLKKYSDDLRNG